MGKNWEWSYKQGRIKRIKAEASAKLNGTPFNPSEVPLHSYDGTMQSKFAKGWHSVTEVDIQRHISGDNTYHAVKKRLAERFGGCYE